MAENENHSVAEHLKNFLQRVVDLFRSIISNDTSGINAKKEVEIYYDAQTKQAIEEFKRRTNENFELHKQDHLECLKQLWHFSFREELANEFQAESSHWRELGFQNSNPVSDIRGAGLYGVHNLVYFAVHYPNSYKCLSKGLHHSGREGYPFACAGFNITMLLFGLLGWGMRKTVGKANIPEVTRRKLINLVLIHSANNANVLDTVEKNLPRLKAAYHSCNILPQEKPQNASVSSLISFDDEDFVQAQQKTQPVAASTPNLYSHGTDAFLEIPDSSSPSSKESQESVPKSACWDVAFNELYCFTLYLLDQEWYKSNATYMKFPEVLERVQNQVLGEIDSEPTLNFERVLALNQQMEEEMKFAAEKS